MFVSSLLEITTYRTVKSRGDGLYKEKGSKFIGIVQACYSEEEAKVLLEEWNKEHHKARHLCYAYRFGADKRVFRANDDGEPGNSAGAPILGQIQAFDLTNVLIGVVRYYGGTKLGVGGLINAYRTAAKEAIENTTIIERKLRQVVSLSFDYTVMHKVIPLLKKHNAEFLEEDLGAGCKFEVSLDLALAGMVISQLEKVETIKITIKGIY
jgi:uncharacterized YigZ family protein